MLAAFNDLSWQFQALVAEAFLSILIAGWLAQRGYQRGLGTIAFGLTWNAIALTLFLTGGAHVSWQHIVYLGTFVADTLSITYKGRKYEKPVPIGFWGACALTLMGFGLVALLVTG